MLSILNGRPVPYDLPLPTLLNMLESNDMTDFALACEILATHKTQEVYEVLKKYLEHKDKYKRRYVWSIIFAFPEAQERITQFTDLFYAKDMIFVNAAFRILLHYRLPVGDIVIFDAIRQHHTQLDAYFYDALLLVQGNEENFQRLLSMYYQMRNQKDNRSKREAVARALQQFWSNDHFEELFALFQKDEFSKIRYIACNMAAEKQRVDLVRQFLDDLDGHVRKLARCSQYQIL